MCWGMLCLTYLLLCCCVCVCLFMLLLTSLLSCCCFCIEAEGGVDREDVVVDGLRDAWVALLLLFV